MRETEVRTLPEQGELRAVDEDGARKLVGYAAVFNSWSEDLGGFREQIKPGAFADVLAAGRAVAVVFNHDPSQLLGRTGANAVLAENTRGLRYEVTLGTSDLDDMLWDRVNRGLITGNSFAFRMSGELEDEEWAGSQRTIKRVDDLVDVGPVTYPAYAKTVVSARCLEMVEQAAKPLATPIRDAWKRRLSLFHW